MHNSSINNDRSGKLAKLRFDAEYRLKSGTAPPTKGWALSADALTILYKLASSPESAGEGLKLLHELQAYQVELDLQHEQLEANDHESELELIRYKTLYDSAPVGYFVVGFEGRIIESNRAGAQLFGTSQEELAGRSIDQFLAPEFIPSLRKLLGKLHFEGAAASCDALTHPKVNGSRRLRIHANISPSGEAVLLVVSAQD